MQVLPTAPSPTVTHLMNLVTLISLPPRSSSSSSSSSSPAQAAALRPHTLTHSTKRQHSTAATSGSEKQQQQGSRNNGQERNGAALALLVFSGKAVAYGRQATPLHAKAKAPAPACRLLKELAARSWLPPGWLCDLLLPLA